MPRLEQHLHFHQVDIATFSRLVCAWYPDKKLDERVTRPATRHRAMPDVRASLEEMRFYCQEGFGVNLAALRQAACQPG
jgi:oligoribonuclease